MEQRRSEVENLVIDRGFWNGRRVFVTGHTGFKGGWTALLLRFLGANVFGFALPPSREPSLFAIAGIEHDLEHRIGDLREFSSVHSAIEDAKPEIIIHLGAQALVQHSYSDPVSTYATNVLGTVHVLEAARRTSSVRGIVVVTSDKCYENDGTTRKYRETDALGGHDPYSSSKGCAELVCDAYRRSFFDKRDSARVASARAGNVIGGGDWAENRLLPDAVRAFASRSRLRIRNPEAVRPWQYVLDPVVAYLMLAERLVSCGDTVAEAWNFGPSDSSAVTVAWIANELAKLWGRDVGWDYDGAEYPREAQYLALDCAKARRRLNWRPLFDLEEGLRLTVEWYRAFQDGAEMRGVTLAQLEHLLETRLPPMSIPRIPEPPVLPAAG